MTPLQLLPGEEVMIKLCSIVAYLRGHAYATIVMWTCKLWVDLWKGVYYSV